LTVDCHLYLGRQYRSIMNDLANVCSFFAMTVADNSRCQLIRLYILNKAIIIL